MIAHLYITPESFYNNAKFSMQDIEEKIFSLSDDVINIERFKDTNKLYTNFDSIYKQDFYLKFTVYDFICEPQIVKQTVDRDIVNAFQKIFEKASDTKISSQEVIEELLDWHNENECNGLIAFHIIPEIDVSLQLIYNISGWHKFRSHFLGLYPKNNIFFIEECKKYLPKIFFHENTKTSVAQILSDFSISIIRHLQHLNYTFYGYKDRSFSNETIKYQTFTSECKLEAKAASKDSNDAKEQLTYTFHDNNGNIQSITCYPHLRLCKSDVSGDTHYYQHRIYFHEGLPNIQNGKILVPHIGVHRP